MKLNFFFRCGFILAAGLSFTACSSRPTVVNYPTREIDRPLTVPDGLTKWHLVTSTEKYVDDSISSRTDFTINPFFWETSITNDWSLLWAPLPLGVAHQFWNTENSRLGFIFGSGLGYGTQSGLTLYPKLSIPYRYKFNADVALDTSTFFNPTVAFKDGEKYRWSAGISAGPLFQVSNTVAIKPAYLYRVNRGRHVISALSTADDETQYHTGAELSASISAGQQWTIKSAYSFLGFDSPNSYKSHELDFTFTHIW